MPMDGGVLTMQSGDAIHDYDECNESAMPTRRASVKVKLIDSYLSLLLQYSVVSTRTQASKYFCMYYGTGPG